MNKNIVTIILLYIAFLIVGCTKDNTIIYQNKPFEEVYSSSIIEKSPFCIVLVDSAQGASKNYLQHLQEHYNHLTNKAVYNIVDINLEENKWYIKWLYPVSTPLTCVFSPQGELIDLIPGVSKESFLYSEEAVINTKTTDFHWPNRFKMNKKEVVPLLNSLLEQKRYLDNGIYSSSELDPIIDSLSYPYPIYLKLVGALMEHDTIISQQVAQSLIELETPAFLDLYKNEFITAKKVLDPFFDINAEPNIRVDNTTLVLNDCEINQKYPIDITIYNDGEHPLN